MSTSVKLPKEAIKKLENIFPEGRIIFRDSEEICSYFYDSSSVRGIPEVVLFPEKEEEVIEVLKIAENYKIPVTLRGAGTSTTGSSVSQLPGILMVFTRMNKILEINPLERTVVVEPGVVNKELNNVLREYGLFYPPDPASYAFSTIGGNVATSAGGPKGLKYGTTKDYVLNLKVVLPGGHIFYTGKPVLKQAAGYNLTSLMVGSEGTLGVFTKIVLKVLPLPEKRALFLIFFQEETKAFEIMNDLLEKGITPSSAEFVDLRSVKMLAESKLSEEIYPPFQEKLETLRPESLLFLELDGYKESVLREKEILEKVLKSAGIFFFYFENEEKMERIWEIRRKLSPVLRRLGEVKLSDDIVIPRRFLAPFVKTLRKIERREGVSIVAFGHAGDGNLHVSIYSSREKKERAKKIREEIIEEVWKYNGTCSGEHGIGILKKEFFAKEYPPLVIEIMKKLKKIFDPSGILNPLVKLP